MNIAGQEHDFAKRIITSSPKNDDTPCCAYNTSHLSSIFG